MGRGRQKAKHAKIARDLKYNSPDTDLSTLERELRAKRTATDVADKWSDEPDYSEYADKYDDLYEDEDDADSEDDDKGNG